MTYDQYPGGQYSEPAQNYDAQPGHTAGEPPVGEPYFGVSFFKALKRFFAGYVKFDGRASRSEYWWAYLWMQILLIVPILIYIIGVFYVTINMSYQAATSTTMDPDLIWQSTVGVILWMLPMFIVSLALTLPSYSIMWRRLHDAGFSGLLALLNLVGLGIIPLIMCIMPTSREALKYGPGAVPQMMPPQQYPPQQYQQQYPPQQY